MHINFNEIYSINPDYLLRHDLYRTFVVSRERQNNDSSNSWKEMIHPLQAQFFSFFTHGNTLNLTIKNIANHFNLECDEVLSIISPYVDNKEEFTTSFCGEDFPFPKNFIVRGEKTYKKFKPEHFKYENLDFNKFRMFSGPMDMTLMLTNTCATNCVYCYADVNHKVQNHLSLDVIKKIIKNAYDLNVNDFGLLGGEIFFHKNWKEVFQELDVYGFFPEIISTKYPLNENQIQFLKNMGISKIQISLDSVDNDILARMLKTTNSYTSKIFNTIYLLNKYEFDIQIAITLTKHNSSVKQIDDLLDFLSKYKKIVNVDIGPAFYSLYLDENFDKWGISKDDFDTLLKYYVYETENKYSFEINFDTSFTDRGFYSCFKGSNHFNGGACSANRTHMFVLPDGKVTICEQLYWKEDFIIGDLNFQTIEEIWNSPKALKLASLGREDFSENSACKHCNNFDSCHENVNKCWVDIIKAFGEENWDYPDPRCAFAPKMINNIQF